jgi:hypothetical protein
LECWLQLDTVIATVVDSTIVPEVAVIVAVPDPVLLGGLTVKVAVPGVLTKTLAEAGDRLQLVVEGVPEYAHVKFTVPLNPPNDVTVIVLRLLSVLFFLAEAVIGFALIEKSCTVSVKVCVALLPTPLLAVIVIG